MEPALYERFFEVEDTYWWSVWVRRMVRDWLPEGPASRRVLDLGCGTGALSQDLFAAGQVVSLDYATDALPFCRRRNLTRLVRADGHALPFTDAAFEVVVALDTLEHLRDDALAMREVRRVLQPGGTVIINVPALQILWGPHDVANHHFRRYHRAQLRRVIEDAGFTLRKLSYTNLLLFPPALVVRLGKRVRGSTEARADDEILNLHPVVNRGLLRLMDAERAVVRRTNLPVGTSLFAVARAR